MPTHKYILKLSTLYNLLDYIPRLLHYIHDIVTTLILNSTTMSDLFIACQHPWQPIPYDKAGVTMKFCVGNGTNMCEYDLHTAVLKDRSEYFRSK